MQSVVDQNRDITKAKKKWFFEWWGVLIIIIILLIFIFLVYFGILVYNEYQKIKSGAYLNNNIEQFITKQKKFALADQRLNYNDDPYLGNLNAKVKIIEFGDFQCPYCRESFPVIRKIATQYGNQILIVYRDFPLEVIHPQAKQAAIAASCADEQNKFWPYHDKLFINQENLDKMNWLTYAKELNLNITQFQNCLANPEKVNEVEADYQDGVSLGVGGTPTFFINGTMIAGSLLEDLFKNIIDYFLKINN